jgi:hypothetical protein
MTTLHAPRRAARLTAALLVLAGCSSSGSKPAPPNPVPIALTDAMATYYLDLRAAGLDGVEGFQLRNLGSAPVGVVIDQVFAADDASGNDIVPVFNFDAPETGTRTWGFHTGVVSGGSWYSGEVAAPVAPATAVDITGFASPAVAGHAFLGITMRDLSATVKGAGITLVPIVGGAEVASRSWTIGQLFRPGPTPPAPPEPETELTDTFATYYVDVAAAGLTGLEGFHLQNLSGEQVGVVIDRVFAADNQKGAYLVDVFDFAAPETGTHYWGFSEGTVADGAWSSGPIDPPVAPATEVEITGFATNQLVSHELVGFTMKNLSPSVKGQHITLVPIIAGAARADLAKTIGHLVTAGAMPEPPHAPTQLGAAFATYYLNLSDAALEGLEGFHFKNLTDHDLGFEIDEIFGADDTAGANKETVFAFDHLDANGAPTAEDGAHYWGFSAHAADPGVLGGAADGIWSSGVVPAPAPGGETYIVGFATAVFSHHPYVGFTMRNVSPAATGGEITFVPIIGSPLTDKQLTLGQLFLPAP